MCLAQEHNAVKPVRLEPVASLSQVQHSTTEPLLSLIYFVISALEVFKLVRGFLFVFSDNKDQKVSFSVVQETL